MTIRTNFAAIAVVLAATPALSQNAVPIDCTLPANAGVGECLSIPDVPPGATAFLPAIAPILGVAIVALAGGGSGGQTPTTPTTPSTN